MISKQTELEICPKAFLTPNKTPSSKTSHKETTKRQNATPRKMWRQLPQTFMYEANFLLTWHDQNACTQVKVIRLTIINTEMRWSERQPINFRSNKDNIRVVRCRERHDSCYLPWEVKDVEDDSVIKSSQRTEFEREKQFWEPIGLE